jgi:hypothetical protein
MVSVVCDRKGRGEIDECEDCKEQDESETKADPNAMLTALSTTDLND